MSSARSPDCAELVQAVRLHGAGDVRVDEVSPSLLSEGDIRLRMRCVGICGSDLHYFREGGTGANNPSSPLVLGHEIAAEVTGKGGEELGVPAGTLVAVDPASPCRKCEWCRRGDVNLCPNVNFKGAGTHPGGLSTYLWAKKEQVIPVPQSISPDVVALLEPLGVAIHAVDLAEVCVADSVAVLGAGPIGLLLAQVAKYVGATPCYVIDPIKYRLQTASSLGADRTSQSHKAMDRWTEGRGVDVVLEATNSHQALSHAVESARIGGTVVLVGIPEGNHYEMTASEARRKGLTIKFSRRMRNTYPRAIRIAQASKVELAPIATHHASFEKAPSAIASQAGYEDDVIKTMIHSDSEDKRPNERD